MNYALILKCMRDIDNVLMRKQPGYIVKKKDVRTVW